MERESRKSIVIGLLSKFSDNSICVNGNWYTLSKYPDKNVDFTKLKKNNLYEFIILDNKYVINYNEIKNISDNLSEEIKEIDNMMVNSNSEHSNLEVKNKNDIVFFIKDYRIAKMNALSHAMELYKLKIEKEKIDKIDYNDVINIANEIFNYIFSISDIKEMMKYFYEQEIFMTSLLNNFNQDKEEV